MVPGLQELMQFSSSTSSLDFVVFCIVPSGWHSDKGTGVSGYHNTSPISTLACKAWNKMLPKRSLVIVTVTSFLTDALVTLNLPAWVAKFLIFCRFMGQENLPESLTQSSMNWPCAFLAALALMVCSNVKSSATRENCFDVLFTAKQPFRKFS